MIWEYELPTIVMLTQCSEAGKVHMPAENTCEYTLSMFTKAHIHMCIALHKQGSVPMYTLSILR